MKAKDTVMSAEQMSEEIQAKTKKWGIVNPEFIEDIAYIIAKTQAEISFKAGTEYAFTKEGHETISYLEGYQEGEKISRGFPQDEMEQIEEIHRAGIKEVVEWVKEHSFLERCDPDTEGYFCTYRWVDEDDWRTKLGEWGL